MSDETYRRILIATMALVGFGLLVFSICRDAICGGL